MGQAASFSGVLEIQVSEERRFDDGLQGAEAPTGTHLG